MTSRSPRLPFAPLLRVAGGSWAEIERVTGVNNSRLFADNRLGGLTPPKADRFAVAFGYTPGELWGDEWWGLPDGACGPADPTDSDARRRRKAATDRARHQRLRKQRIAA
jgi:hypothetical protein